MTFDEKLEAIERLSRTHVMWWRASGSLWACGNTSLGILNGEMPYSDWGYGDTPEEALDRYWDLLVSAKGVQRVGLYNDDYTWDNEKREWRAVIRQRVRVRV